MQETGAGHPNRRIIMLVVFVGVLMGVIDGIVVAIALPTITTDFSVPVAQSQWVITAYLVTMTSLLLVFGRVAEHVGKARLFVAGFAIFTASSLACGLSNGLFMLILYRVIQAIGAAMVFSISWAIIFAISPPGDQGKAMGYLGSTVAVGSIAGPVLGGLIVDTLGWEYIFLINVPIGLVLLPLAVRHLRFDETLCRCLEMDWPGAAGLVVSMVALIIFLGEASANPGPNTLLIVYGVAFAIAISAFLVHESRTSRPLLDLSIFRQPAFAYPVTAMMLFFVAIFMVNIVGPFYFEGVMALQPFQVGLVFLISPTIMVVASPVMGSLYDRYRFRHSAAIGMVVVSLALAGAAFAARAMDLLLSVAIFVPMALGSALFQAPNNTEIMRALPPTMAGTASSVTATVRNLGMALGVSFAGILISVQLAGAGYHGPILNADRSLLAGTVSTVLVAASIGCALAAAVSLLRERSRAKVEMDGR
jgi:EmrB/QacA subfamily drug resistance transporter